MMKIINPMLQIWKMKFKELIYTESVPEQTVEETEAKIPISENLLLLLNTSTSMPFAFIQTENSGPL